MNNLVLAASSAVSAVYLVFLCYRSASLARTLIKTAATATLTLWAYLAGGPPLLVIALGLSTLGDALLGAGEKRYLLHGMAAFFAAHLAYIALFWGLAASERGLYILIAQIALTVGAAAFIRSLMPYLEKSMRLPVLAYSIIILVMGNAALRLDGALHLAALGALAFMLSDLILSFELFRLGPDSRVRRVTSPLIWLFYYGGQALIAYGVIQHFT